LASPEIVRDAGDTLERAPTAIAKLVGTLFQNVGERSLLARDVQEQAYGFVNRLPRLVGAGSGTGDIDRHCVRNVLIAFAPDPDRVFDAQ
jgi:hypothetical protein